MGRVAKLGKKNNIYAAKLAIPDAGVAQSAEHVLGKDGVTGSIPVSSL